MILSSILALSAFVLMVWLLLKPDQPLWLYFYLGTLFLTTPIEWVVAWAYGPLSDAYRLTWIGATILVLLAICLVAYEHLRLVHYKLRALALSSLIAATLARMAYLGIHGRINLDDRLVLSEAFLLLWGAILVGGAASHGRRADISLVLMAIWMSQAIFQFGYLLHWPLWNNASWIAGPAIGIGGLLAIGWRLKRYAPS